MKYRENTIYTGTVDELTTEFDIDLTSKKWYNM